MVVAGGRQGYKDKYRKEIYVLPSVKSKWRVASGSLKGARSW